MIGECSTCNSYIPSLLLKVPVVPRLWLYISVTYHASFPWVSSWFSSDSLGPMTLTFIKHHPKSAWLQQPHFLSLCCTASWPLWCMNTSTYPSHPVWFLKTHNREMHALYYYQRMSWTVVDHLFILYSDEFVYLILQGWNDLFASSFVPILPD